MARARLNGIELEYESLGDSSRCAVIMIRGLGTQMIEWPKTMLDRLLGLGYRVVIFDNRDSGLSSKPQEPYDLSDMVEDTIALMSHLSIEAGHVIGLSMGGIIAQFMAAYYPERVKSLTSIMSTSGDTGLPLPDRYLLELMSANPASKEEWVELAVNKRRILRGPDFPESPEEARENVEALVRRCYDPEATKRQEAAAIVAAQQLERFERIRVPTLVIHGKKDSLVSTEHGRDTATRITDAKYVEIASMGHSVPDELGGEIAEVLNNFYRSLRDR